MTILDIGQTWNDIDIKSWEFIECTLGCREAVRSDKSNTIGIGISECWYRDTQVTLRSNLLLELLVQYR